VSLRISVVTERFAVKGFGDEEKDDEKSEGADGSQVEDSEIGCGGDLKFNPNAKPHSSSGRMGLDFERAWSN
jgi:hypothetical protein